MMCQCRFINYDNRVTVVVAVDNRGGYTRVWEISVPSSQFCCEPKTALKTVLLFFFLKAGLLDLQRDLHNGFLISQAHCV